MPPHLSVLLSAYNAEKYIAEAIQSILDQTFTAFELLIADDGSEDNTRKIIDGFNDPRIKVDHNSQNLGKVITCNRLLSITKGKYVTIHDADDISLSDRFTHQIAFLEKNPSIAMVGCDFYNVTNSGQRRVHMPSDFNEIKKALPRISQFHGPTLMFKKEIVQEVGGLFRSFTWGEDIDFTSRVVEKFNATNLNIPLYRYRIHDKSLTNDITQLTPERFANVELRILLSDQRREHGKDMLMNGDLIEFENERHAILQKLGLQKDKMFWEFSQRLWHHKLFGSARKAAVKAFMLKPTFRNLKNAGYMILASIRNPS